MVKGLRVWARFLTLLLGVALVALGAEGLSRVEYPVDVPLTPADQVAAVSLHPTLVRLEGTLEAAPDQVVVHDVVLERVQVDSGRYPKPDARTRLVAFFRHQRLASWLDYDMVSPPRIALQCSPTVSVDLQTEDVDLSAWPDPLTVQVPPGGPYPDAVTSMLMDSLPALPAVSAPATVRVYTYKLHQAVTVLGELAKDGTDTVVRAPQRGPYVVTPLSYAAVRSLLWQGERRLLGISLGGVLIGLVLGWQALRPRH